MGRVSDVDLLKLCTRNFKIHVLNPIGVSCTWHQTRKSRVSNEIKKTEENLILNRQTVKNTEIIKRDFAYKEKWILKFLSENKSI